jgi:probable rRNA maturation factor
MENNIQFFKEGIRFRLNDQAALRKWLVSAARKEKFRIEALNYIFCDDKYLLDMNKAYLKHNYYTDIITFDNSLEKYSIIGDVYISIDSVRKNAVRFNTTFNDELRRVMVHGLLHLVGYKDKTEKDKKRMRNAENLYLNLF